MAKSDKKPNSRSPKGLLVRLFGLGRDRWMAEPLIVPRAEHNISRKGMAEEVLKVLYRLHNSGFKAYLVGGAVRDLLLGRTPKDYDVSTDARPDEIKKHFANCRLIGRRFRLAHIVFRGGHVIEVATFRRNPDLPETEGDTERDLLISEDNTWGTPQEDAYRRDFTVNALFYNVADFSVIDYVGGLHDLKEGLIRTIGDAGVRFREDPVRMLRAVEYAARLGFQLHPDIRTAIHRHRRELRRSSDVRIADEILHLLRSGASEPAMRMLREMGLIEVLHTGLHAALEGERAEAFFSRLKAIDALQGRERLPRDAALLAQLYVAPLERAIAAEETRKGGRLSKGEFLVQAERVMAPETAFLPLPNRRRFQIQQAMLAVDKMRRPPSRHRGGDTMVQRAYFLDAFDLLRIDAEAGLVSRKVLAEWEELRAAAEREGKLVDPDAREERAARRRGGRGRRGEERREEGETQSRRRGRGERERGRDRETGGPDRGTAPPAEQDQARAPQRRTPEREGGRRETTRRDRSRRDRSRRERTRRPEETPGTPAARPEEKRSAEQRESRPDRTREERGRSRGGRSSQSRTSRTRPETPAPVGPITPRELSAPPPEPRVEAGPPPERKENVELIAPPAGEMQHGRNTRERRSWNGQAGQTHGTIKKMKEGLVSGEFTVPPADQIPYVVPGKSIKQTMKDWDSMVGRADEIAADETHPESHKWGRTKRRREPGL
jgi:poly(A) polymerase